MVKQLIRESRFPEFDNLIIARGICVHYTCKGKGTRVLVHKEDIQWYTFEQLRKRINELGDHYGDKNCEVDISYEHGYYDSIEMISHVQGFRDETDEEYAARLEIVQEERKKTNEIKRIQAKERETCERKEYEKLKKKFEKDAK